MVTDFEKRKEDLLAECEVQPELFYYLSDASNDYEVWNWCGWRHSQILSVIACLFLTVEARLRM